VLSGVGCHDGGEVELLAHGVSVVDLISIDPLRASGKHQAGQNCRCHSGARWRC
jgi:hypothetical protein